MWRSGLLAYAVVLLVCVVFSGTAFGLAVESFSFTKSVDKTAVVWGDSVTYTYTVSNTSTNNGTTIYDVEVWDDNGTPDDPGDDFLVGSIDQLGPRKSATFTVTRRLTRCAPRMRRAIRSIPDRWMSRCWVTGT